MEAKHALQNDLTKDVDLDHIKNINPNLTLIALTDKMETVIENGRFRIYFSCLIEKYGNNVITVLKKFQVIIILH